MRHAGVAALDRLEPFLRVLRKQSKMKERTRGVFYCGGRAFLHFHEHGDEFWADVRLSDEFERLPATSAKERAALLARIRKSLGDGDGRRTR